jgi:hypothetical protein
LALMAPAQALARDSDSGRRMWDAYPLPATGSDAVGAAAAPAVASQPSASDVATPPSDGVERLAAASLLALIAGAVATWLFSLRRPRDRLAAVAGPAPAPVARDTAPLRSTTPELWVHSVASPPVEPVAPEPVEVDTVTISEGAPAPPEPDRAWAAEIVWYQVDGGAQFSVAARPVEGGAEPVTLGVSPPLEWPPGEARAVQALTDAVKTLESMLVAAGWTPLPRGSAWYAKRFTWQPGARPVPAPTVRTRHRKLYESEFSRQVERTDRMRRTISERLLEQSEQVAAATQD